MSGEFQWPSTSPLNSGSSARTISARVTEGLNRRRFLKGVAAAAGAAAVASPALYFGYQALKGKPVKAALIGGGDEGGVLVGQHNRDFLEFIAVCDLRPYNLDIKSDGKHGGRIFEGDPKVPLRPGFSKLYGSDANKIKAYRDVEQMLKENPDIEAVVIATPLVTHAPLAIECMPSAVRGKPIHVLCEKLMARTIRQCKEMIDVAKETAASCRSATSGTTACCTPTLTTSCRPACSATSRHIRALWHRNNSWPSTRRTPNVAKIPQRRAADPRRLVSADPGGGLRGAEGQASRSTASRTSRSWSAGGCTSAPAAG